MQDVSCRKRLAEIVGSENLVAAPESMRQDGWEGPLPKALVCPSSEEQVCEVMRLSHAERLTISPAGNLTKLRLGGVPQPTDLLLSLSRLNSIAEYQPADLTITAGAGLRVREMASVLREKGQMLPLDAPFAAEATVGGVLATNGSGPRRLAYGGPRDMVIGMRFVTAEGNLVKSGGKVVKNVAGYDMAKMLIGSFGTLGIITDATFKVFPVPSHSVTLLLGFPTARQALRAGHRILNSPFAPQALDFMDAAAGAITRQTALSEAPFSLMVAVAGPEALVERARREVPSLVRPDGWETLRALTDEDELKLWREIQEIMPAALRVYPDAAIVKASVLLSCVGDLLERAQQAASDHGLSLATLARVGTGVAYCYLWPPAQTDSASRVERTVKACEALLAEANRLGGRAIVEWCPSRVKERVNLWGPLQDDFPLMQRLKEHFDPQGILNPGRFYGGI